MAKIFTHHGAPKHLISDRGAPFVGALFNEVVRHCNYRLTTAYHLLTNANERVNSTLKTAFRAYGGDKHRP